MSFNAHTFTLQTNLIQQISEYFAFSQNPTIQLIITCFVGYIISKLFSEGSINFNAIKKYFQKEYVVNISYSYLNAYGVKYKIGNGNYETELLVNALSEFLLSSNKTINQCNAIMVPEASNNSSDNEYEKYIHASVKSSPTTLSKIDGYNIWYADISIKKLEKDSVDLIGYQLVSDISIEYIHDFLTKCYTEYIERAYGDTKTLDNRYLFVNVASDSPGNKGKVQSRYNHYKLNSKITFDDVFFTDKDKLLYYLNRFQKGELPKNKLTILLHGPPGTGKTSIIKAISSKMKRSIQRIKVSTVSDYEELMDLVFSTNIVINNPIKNHTLPLNKKIIVFEDFDRDDDSDKSRSPEFSIDRKREHGISDADLLQLFDGIIELNDIITIITTNNVEKLDKALIRPGRIDLNLYIGNLTVENGLQMTKRIFKAEKIPDQIKTILETKCTTGLSPAEWEMTCLAHPTVLQLVLSLS
eukprot:Pompholyxophrys_sp_v1_NODE_1_length_32789_cov_6.460653.p6 type:complete len:470 gc:universal NODE_1_length_32789_cov_6.460653:16645-15236(-)